MVDPLLCYFLRHTWNEICIASRRTIALPAIRFLVVLRAILAPALSPPSLSSFALSRPNVASPLIHPVFSLPHISFSKPSPILVAAEGLPDDSNIST